MINLILNIFNHIKVLILYINSFIHLIFDMHKNSHFFLLSLYIQYLEYISYLIFIYLRSLYTQYVKVLILYINSFIHLIFDMHKNLHFFLLSLYIQYLEYISYLIFIYLRSLYTQYVKFITFDMHKIFMLLDFIFLYHYMFLKRFKEIIFFLLFSFIFFKFFLLYEPVFIKNKEILYSCLPLWKLLILTLIPIFHLSFINKNNFFKLKIWSLMWSLIIFVYLLFFLEYFNICSYCNFGKNSIFPIHTFFIFNKVFILYGIDIMSLIFLILTSFLFVIVFFYLTASNMLELKKFLILLYILYFCLIHIFTAQNLLFFFFFFESAVIPMFLLILVGGSRFQKTKAAYYFFFFTVFGSLFMFISINYLLLTFGSVNIHTLIYKTQSLDFYTQSFIWLSFFLSFAVKIPMFAFYTWLPEAHVEAPTVGSVLLAGILLKLGVYGCIRVLFFLFPEVNVFFSSYVYVLALIGVIFSSLIAIRQTDIKRIIAYASISHMNIIMIGLYSFDSIGIYGAIYQSVSHALVSSALFLLIGILYERYKTRLLSYYSGLTQVMPIFSSFFLFFILANISFPLTSNFIGELLIFISISKLNLGLIFISLSSVILNTIYSLWFCNRLLYGNLKSHLLIKYKDILLTEFIILSLLAISVCILGIYPNILLNIPSSYYYSLEYYCISLEILNELYL